MEAVDEKEEDADKEGAAGMVTGTPCSCMPASMEGAVGPLADIEGGSADDEDEDVTTAGRGAGKASAAPVREWAGVR